MEISGLKYFGKTEGDNNLRKAKAWLGYEWLEKVKDLQVGEFLMQYGSKVKLEKTRKWISLTKPQRLMEYQYSNRTSESLLPQTPFF